MKKPVGRIIVLGLMFAVLVAIFSMGGGIAAQAEDVELVFGDNGAVIGPFAAMYDSDELIREQLEFLLKTERNMAGMSSDWFSDDVADEIDREAAQYEMRLSVERQSEIRNELKSVLSVETGALLDGIAITEHTHEEIANAIERAMEDRYIIKYKDNSTVNGFYDAMSVAGLANGLIERTASDISLFNSESRMLETDAGRFEVITFSEKVNPRELADQLRESGLGSQIEYMEPDFIQSYASLSGLGEEEEEQEGEEEGTEEGATEVDAEGDGEELLPDLLIGGDMQAEVIVTLIDAGVDTNHPALAGKLLEGWNFVEDNDTLYDASNPLASAHGTHLAGIIADTTGDYPVQILPLKVFGDNGARTSDIIAAIEYAETQGAQVVNCSFGSTYNSQALRDAMEASSMLFVASVGNSRTDLNEQPVYPACYGLDNLISVTSVNADGGLSYFSNYSNILVDISALGRDVYSALPESQYGLQSGTSMSAAFVSAAAGMVLTIADLPAAETRTRIIAGGDMLSNLQNTVIDGRRLNLANVIDGVEGDYLLLNPSEDFDVFGYSRTPEEEWVLFSGKTVIQIAARGTTQLALCSDGTVWAWGNNSHGQVGDGTTIFRTAPVQVLGLTDVTAIAAGWNHNLALKEDETVWVWGYSGLGQVGDGTNMTRTSPVQVNGLTNVISIGAGDAHSLAVKSDGTVWAWGSNYQGQLGDNTTIHKNTPVQVGGLTGVSYVSGGDAHSLAVKLNGTVWAWGDNWAGQLGDGTTTQRKVPIQVSGLTGITQVSGGVYFSMALKSNGTVWAWGASWNGQLGNGTTSYNSSDYTPTQISTLSGIVDIFAGTDEDDASALAVDGNGALWAWGGNYFGQLGDGSYTGRTTPAQVTGLTNVAMAVNCYGYSVALLTTGEIWGWGSYTPWNSPSPTMLDIAEIVFEAPAPESQQSKIAAGYYHSLLAKADGTVWAWGGNNNGQLGDGTTTGSSTPVPVTTLSSVVAVSAGSEYSLALEDDGTVWAWGRNYYGQLGDGTTTNSSIPIAVSNLSDVVAIAAGWYHNLALKDDGTVWAWGNNSSGQLGNGTTTNSLTPTSVSVLTDIVAVSAGYSHCLALKSDGTVWFWGTGYSGNGTSATSLNPVQVSGLDCMVSVMAGEYYSMAVRADGTVWAWGVNWSGQLGDGTYTDRLTPVRLLYTNSIKSIVYGSDLDEAFSMALKEDGSMYAWGSNWAGQLGDGTTTYRSTPAQISSITGVMEIAAGGGHSLAIKSDGTVWTWGWNGNGQLGDGTAANVSTPTQIDIVAFDNMIYSSIISLDITAGKTYNVTLKGQGITDFQGKTITISYDSAKLQLVDLCAATKGKELTVGVIAEMGITITDVSAGEIQITCDKTIPSGREWNGILNVITFKALSGDSTSLEVFIE